MDNRIGYARSSVGFRFAPTNKQVHWDESARDCIVGTMASREGHEKKMLGDPFLVACFSFCNTFDEKEIAKGEDTTAKIYVIAHVPN